jgi:hypothetical protein
MLSGRSRRLARWFGAKLKFTPTAGAIASHIENFVEEF